MSSHSPTDSQPGSTTAWRRRLRLLRDDRGTASTETVLMMPAFLVLWGSVFYVFTLGRNIVEMNVRIREGAWQRAYDGCRSTPESPTRIGGDAFDGSGATGSTDTPLFGSVLDMLFREFHASRTGDVEQPRVLGGETQRYRGDMLWMCNEDPEDYEVANFISEAWGAFGL
ncbi:MAG: hypothetical protein ACK6CU_06985 [Deltaproteobacteria bacterium]|jgi:hypothetical protein